jgi:hypothetical protein
MDTAWSSENTLKAYRTGKSTHLEVMVRSGLLWMKKEYPTAI